MIRCTHVIVAALVAVLLVGCSPEPEAPPPPQIVEMPEVNDENCKPQNVAKVRDVVGYEYNAGRNGSASEVTYSWTDKTGTAATQFLSVAFNAQDQSVFKSIQVKGGRSDSQSWK